MRLLASCLCVSAACGRFGFESGATISGTVTDASTTGDAGPCAAVRQALAADGTNVYVTWSGTSFGVSWEDSVGMRFMQIDPLGVRSAITTVRSATGSSVAGQVAPRSGGFAASWYEYDSTQNRHNVGFTLIDSAGAVTGSTSNVRDVIATQGIVAYFPIVAHSAGYAVAVTDMRSGSGNYSVYLSPVTTSGTKAGADVPLIIGSRRTLNDIAVSGTTYIAAFTGETNNNLYLGRRTFNGNLVGSDLLVSTALSNLAKISVTDEVAIVYPETDHARLGRYDVDLTPIATVEVPGSRASGSVMWPSIARAGANYVVSWFTTATVAQFHQVVMAPSGEELASFSEPASGGETVAATAPGAHLTAWNDGSTLEMRIACH